MPPLRVATPLPLPRILRAPRSGVISHFRTLSSCHHHLPTRSAPPTRALSSRFPHSQKPFSQDRVVRNFATSSGKSQGDEIVEELQELYEEAKDEFEIATESTDGATIYAASDRESARDALNQLLAVYSLYTTDIASTAGSQQPEPDDKSQIVETSFDPATIATEVREEVRKRVGHRIRELQNAVEVLEERAKAD